MLKLWIAFLARLLVAAILIEARDGGPGAIRTGLTSLGIELSRKRVRAGKHGTIALEVVLVDLALFLRFRCETTDANQANSL